MNVSVMNISPPASLELTHVLYDAESHVSLFLALVTLSPILLMASYAALAVMTGEIVIINMWVGQLLCEAFNWIIKRIIKQERPIDSYGNGYGFPSSHSQYMGYFATFLIMHLYCRHRFPSTGYWFVDQTFRLGLYMGLIAWAGAVCYSRVYLTYHNASQVIWGVSVGIAFGTSMYTLTEYIPSRWPKSPLGKLRIALLSSCVAGWLRIRDGWAIWEDGGRDDGWQRWNSKWRTQVMENELKKQS